MRKKTKIPFSIKSQILAVLNGLSPDERRNVIQELRQVVGLMALLKKDGKEKPSSEQGSSFSFLRFFGKN
jgi:hypothetical protein